MKKKSIRNLILKYPVFEFITNTDILIQTFRKTLNKQTINHKILKCNFSVIKKILYRTLVTDRV